ncbi:hypothetical protein HBA55_29595 [Pseudomaricurvus alkylphenolicus]|uniref:hypothetical protein n=1 Tax=Pseudomaricurvus alkylphenolicus TaxID=1306991 RepID=UPI00141ED597|nr:hypothetical protein [Pseudomaricurvus alkylphenolicus]NIB43793.1 hypothetical protein [Pseudomaricurvus alkylphenolicus]
MEKQHAVEQAIISGSGTFAKGSGVTAIASSLSQKIANDPDWLSMSDLGIIVGMAGVVIGLLVNLLFQIIRNKRESRYQKREDERAQELHNAKMRAIRRQVNGRSDPKF